METAPFHQPLILQNRLVLKNQQVSRLYHQELNHRKAQWFKTKGYYSKHFGIEINLLMNIKMN